MNEETKELFNIRLGETYFPKGDKFKYIEPSLNMFALWVCLEEIGCNVRGIFWKRNKIDSDYPSFWNIKEKSILFAIKIDLSSKATKILLGTIETKIDFRNVILKLIL